MSNVINKISVNNEVYDLEDANAKSRISKLEENLTEEIESSVSKYLEENPVTGEVSDEKIQQAVSDYMEENSEKFKGDKGEQGEKGEKGVDGSNGENGKDGVGIVSILKTSTNGLVDTYTITLTDGNTSTFTVTNGENGSGGTITITDEQVAKAVETYLTENPIEQVTDEQIQDAVNIYLTENPVESSETDTLKGKKILFIGDSICEGVGANRQPYPYWIQQWHENTTVYNLGVAGMTIAQKDSSITNAMPVRIASGEFENDDYANADIIVFEGGINDLMNNVKLGYIKKSYEITKYNTFCKGMEYMFDYFKGIFPKARMIFCTTHNVTAYDYNKAQAWWGAASEICTKWGVEFLDLFGLICTPKINGLQLHPNYEVHRDYYAPFIDKALISETPLSGAKTTNYYTLNAPCMLGFYNGTRSFSKGATISTNDWRINLIRADLTTYENVSSSVKYDLSDVDNTTEGTYPVHAFYSENGINLSIDVDITITGENTERILDSIRATKSTTTYNVGSEVSTDDIIVTATYVDGSTSDVTSNATFDTSNINNTVTGEYNIAVTYTENDITKTVAIQIDIVESGSTTIVASGTAKDNSNQENVRWSIDSDGVITFDSTKSETTIATYNEAERPWNDYIAQITKAVFKSNIIGTGNSVLINATSLEEVDLQAESVVIGGNAFKGCTSLAEIDLTKVNSIGMYGLSNCTSLPSEIVLGATSLNNYAFYYQSQITVIRFTGTPTSITSEALAQITAWSSSANLTDIYVPWSEGEVANAPWGANNATVHYNSSNE